MKLKTNKLTTTTTNCVNFFSNGPFLGLEPGEAEGKAQTNPLSYGGIPRVQIYKALKEATLYKT